MRNNTRVGKKRCSSYSADTYIMVGFSHVAISGDRLRCTHCLCAGNTNIRKGAASTSLSQRVVTSRTILEPRSACALAPSAVFQSSIPVLLPEAQTLVLKLGKPVDVYIKVAQRGRILQIIWFQGILSSTKHAPAYTSNQASPNLLSVLGSSAYFSRSLRNAAQDLVQSYVILLKICEGEKEGNVQPVHKTVDQSALVNTRRRTRANTSNAQLESTL